MSGLVMLITNLNLSVKHSLSYISVLVLLLGTWVGTLGSYGTCVLDWCACRLLCYALMRIKLISSRCLCELWYACMITCLLHFHAFTHMHCCTPYRYASWNVWRMWCWSQTWRWCWWIHPEDRRIGQVLDWKMLAKRVLSDQH
jgi:hypothetical protein